MNILSLICRELIYIVSHEEILNLKTFPLQQVPEVSSSLK